MAFLMKPYYQYGGLKKLEYYRDELVTVYHGDAREILPTLPVVDLLLTDPPYGIGVTRMQLGDRKVKPLYRGGHWDDSAPDLEPFISHAAHAVIWGGNFFSLPISRGWLVWDKLNGGTSFADCELAWTNLDAPVRMRRISWSGANAKERLDHDRYHPTQKPVALMRWCIEFFPDVETILDPFMGSGSTLRAAKDMGLHAIGIDIDERYCEIAARRMSQLVLL